MTTPDYVPQPWRFNTDGTGFYDDYVAKTWAMQFSDNICGYSDDDYDMELAKFHADLAAHDAELVRATLANTIQRIKAFAVDCVTHGDMTPTAKLMLNRILDQEQP